MSQEQANYLLNQSIPFEAGKIRILQLFIQDLESGDIQKINTANAILTNLKNSKNMFMSISTILSTTQHNQTLIYCLITFQDQLKSYWQYLNQEQKTSLKQYFWELFNKITATNYSVKSAIYRKIKTIIVRIFILDYTPTNTFIQNLINQAKGDQFRCENILDIFIIMADESAQYGFTFLETKYSQIMTLAAMVLKSTHEVKIKSNLIKNSMMVLEKYCLISQSITFPHEIVVILLEIFKTNKFRMQICNLLSVVCSHSVNILVQITNGISNALDWSCSIESYRKSIKTNNSNEIVFTDLFLRAFVGLIVKLIEAHLQLKPPLLQDYLRLCYNIILCLSQSEDIQTWLLCRSAWIIYNKHSMQLLNLEGLSSMIVFKCPEPIQLHSKSVFAQSFSHDNEEREESQDEQNFSKFIYKLSSVFLQNMYSRIWSFVESQTFAKFDKYKFISSTFAFCYLSSFISDKNKIMNMLKLLMNISESVEAEYKRTVVDQFLAVVSFYPSVTKQNYGLATALQDKYVENAEYCINSFLHYSQEVKLSPQGIFKVENKISDLGTEQVSIQIKLWQIVLRSEGNSTDVRMGSQKLNISTVLPFLMRNFAGFRVYGLIWNLRWDTLNQIVINFNDFKLSTQQLSPSEKKLFKKIEQTVVHICEFYCQLCSINSVNIHQNALFSKIVQLIRSWEGFQKVEIYFK